MGLGTSIIVMRLMMMMMLLYMETRIVLYHVSIP